MAPASLPADWLVPDWPAPVGVRAVFTTRSSGVSAPPWNSLNLGSHVGDQPAQVAANRGLLQRAIGRRAVFLSQVHGHAVQRLAPDTPDGRQADACITDHPALACTIMVADCLPVLLTTQDGRFVAAAHAGWRGLAGLAGGGGVESDGDGQGVLESVFSALVASAGLASDTGAAQTLAWLGPCIGPQAFEVGAEVRAAFMAMQPASQHYFVPLAPGKYLADLPGLARLRLSALGITRVYGNDGSAPWCTVANPSRFFSHRRDTAVGTGNGFGTTGRMVACIWRE